MGEMEKDERGWHHKFNVFRTDRRDFPGEKHESCEYFVLDLTHDEHAGVALAAYAEACKKTRPALAENIRARLRVWVNNEED